MKAITIVFDLNIENENPEVIVSVNKAAARLIELAKAQDMNITTKYDEVITEVDDITRILSSGFDLYIDEQNTPIYARAFLVTIDT
jgi:hypothetical protein